MNRPHVPRKRFGQHFLRDQGVIEAIARAIDPARHPDATLVEIGPGEGVLTAPLIGRLPPEAVLAMHAIEIDRDLAARLRSRFGTRLALHLGDVLDYDWASVPGRLRIVGNLPYNISTPLLFSLVPLAERVVDQHFMLQKEVVDRMVAPAGGRNYGRLSVMLQYRYGMDVLLDVPPEAFDPPPKVDSAVVRMVPRSRAELTARDEALLQRLVAEGFSQRRKMLRNTLAPWYARAADAGQGVRAEAIVPPTARAEQIAVGNWVELANLLTVPNGGLIG